VVVVESPLQRRRIVVLHAEAAHLDELVRERLEARAGGREVEIRLPGGYRTTPEVAGAIKAVPGVTAVELV